MSNPLRRLPAAFARPLAAALLIFAAAPAFAQEFRLGALQIIDPWSRATPGGARVTAGYLVIKNAGAEPDRLIAATVEVAGAAGLHEMATVDGVMKMRPLKDGLIIPAHGEIALKPGSNHLMLEDLKHPLAQGENFKGRLTFEKAGPVEVTFRVEPIGAGAPGAAAPAGHMDHMKGM